VLQKIVCSECGYCLYEGDLLKPLQDIIKKYGGRCPKCNKKLVFSPSEVSVIPFEKNETTAD